jgi:hypothetical protein
MVGANRPSEVADDHQKVAIALTVGAVAVAGTGLLLRLISPSAPARTTAFVDPRGLVGFTTTSDLPPSLPSPGTMSV